MIIQYLIVFLSYVNICVNNYLYCYLLTGNIHNWHLEAFGTTCIVVKITNNFQKCGITSTIKFISWAGYGEACGVT